MKKKILIVPEFNKYSSFIVAVIVFSALNMGCSISDKNASLDEKPNIIIVMIDNVGCSDIGINGNDLVNTPHLDSFAKEGIQFNRFYANQLCAPTRASLMTGRYHYRTGVIHTSRGGAKMHGDEVTIAEMLKNVGYATGIFGKWHLGENYPMRPQEQGFDKTLIHKSGKLGQVPDCPNTYINPKLWEDGQNVQKHGYCTDIFFDAAINFIEKNQNKPFFIYLPTNVAHTAPDVGLEIPKKYSAPYIAKGYGKGVATVCGMLNNFDENFGRLIARLTSLGLRGKTLVIFLSDDGNTNRGGLLMKSEDYTPYEKSIKVPCFAQWPGHFPGGLEVGQVASHIDILPTVLDIAGTEPPTGLKIDGLSLLPLLEGKEKGQGWPDRKIFLQLERGLEPHRYVNISIIAEKYKLIGYYPDAPDGGWTAIRPGEPVFELYDIPSDPGEAINLASQESDIVEELKAAYDNWYDDVKSSRQFSPGLIHIGSDAENPTYLCRYQDASYIDKKPTGWPVYIECEGKYEVTINRGESLEECQLVIQYDSTYVSQPLTRGENQAIFSLPSGNVTFNAWVKEPGKEYMPRPNEDKIGDVIIRRIKENE